MSFMKVVAIATIADAVPLTGENRVFTKLGLDALRRAVNPGLKALLEMAQIPATRPPTSGEIAFRIAPRLNAAGRMDVARDVIELFSVKDPARAREIAGRLDQLNAERQEEERRILSGDRPALRAGARVARRILRGHRRRRLASRRYRHHGHTRGRSVMDVPRSCSHTTTAKRMDRADRSALFICWTRLNPAANCSRATAAIRMQSDFLCLPSVFPNCGPILTTMRARA